MTRSESTARLGMKLAPRLREYYPKGTRVQLINMEDAYIKIPTGTLGTVSAVDDVGTIHVSWDTGHTLGIVFGVDSCTKVSRVWKILETIEVD